MAKQRKPYNFSAVGAFQWFCSRGCRSLPVSSQYAIKALSDCDSRKAMPIFVAGFQAALPLGVVSAIRMREDKHAISHN
jgi:hypothetical protein